jgi:TonB-dependent receptor
MNAAAGRKGMMALFPTAAVCLAAAVPALATPPAIVFNLPAEPARLSIPAFAKQSGLQVLASAADLADVTTKPVSGALTPEAALQRLLDGTPLVMQVKANGAILILRPAASPPALPVLSGSTPAEPTDIVVVIGFRKSYSDAIQMKRGADGINDAISSDGLGRFPDLNAGEALQRVTGVQVNREAASRDATINLRGLPGTYARTTLNGQAFAEPILDNSIPLGAFDTDVFSAINVNKSPSAADQPGGLSGNIDLQIAPASGRKPGGFFKAGYEYDDLGGRTSPAATLGYNARLGGRVALFGVVAVKDESFRRDSINFNAYTPLGGPGTPGANGALFPSDIRQLIKTNKGSLVTAAAGVDIRASDTTSLSLSGFSTSRDLSGNSTNMVEIDLRSPLTVVTPAATVFSPGDGNTYFDRLTFNNAQVNTSYRAEPALERVWYVNGALQWRDARWRAKATLVLSRADNRGGQTQIDWRTVPQSGAGNGISGAFASGGGHIRGYSLTVTPDPAVSVTPGPWTWVGPGNPAFQQNPGGDQLVVAGTSGYAANDLRSVQLDLDRALAGGPVSHLIGGLRLERDAFASQGYRTSAKGVDTADIGSGLLQGGPFDGSFFGGLAGGDYRGAEAIDYAYALSHLKPVTLAPGDVLTATGWINDPANSAYAANNFSVFNGIASAYVMARLATTVLGLPVHGNAGLRYETTDQRIDALNPKTGLAGNITYVPQTFRQSYHNWLPSLLLSAELTPDLTLRTAAYTTFVRPQPRNLSPATSIVVTSEGFDVTYGGYKLKPFTADSVDVALEWYNHHGNLVSLDLFRKVIHNLVAADTSLAQLCPADATALGLGHLHLAGTACVSDILVNGQPAVIVATGNSNYPNPLTVDGIEFSAQQNFDFLPGFWRNLGGLFNYSYTQISGHNPDGSRAVLAGVSSHVYNLIGYYETPRFGIRLVYNYRGPYMLTGTGTFTGGPSRVAARSQLDGALSYVLSRRLTLSFDAYNITDARRTQYQGLPVVPRANDYDGRTFTLTLRTIF